MGLGSDREKAIEKYINDNPNCCQKTNIRIEYQGKPINLPIYSLPTSLLTFNLENGRFAADLLALEEEKKRKLNPYTKEDAEIIRNLLLNKNLKETKDLKGDIKRLGQLHPGITTVAGNVINGNRRMAVLTELKKETKDSKYDYFETAILPRAAGAYEIWKIEARLQYGKDFKVNYGPVNELLKIRGAVEKKIPKGDIAFAIGVNESEIDKKLERLKLIEAYLRHIGKPKEYRLIETEGIHEHFINTQDNLKHAKEEGMTANQQQKFLEAQFEAIRSGLPHLEIREFQKFDEEELKDVFTALDKKTKGKMNQDEYRGQVEDTIEMVKVRKRKEKPVQLLSRALDIITKVKNLDTKLDKDAKRNLKKIIDISKDLYKK